MSDVVEWGIVELMGHVRLAGRVSEVERFGAKLGRIDIPDMSEGAAPDAVLTTQFLQRLKSLPLHALLRIRCARGRQRKRAAARAAVGVAALAWPHGRGSAQRRGRRVLMFYAVGIDASLTGLGLVAIPGDWGRDLSRVLRPLNDRGEPTLYGTDPDDGCYPARREKLCRDVVEWVGWLHRKKGSDVQVFIEAGIANPNDIHTIRSQERLAGAIEDAIWRHIGIESRYVEQSSARKLLLGHLPAKDRKQHVVEALSKLAPGWKADHYDALTAANWGMYQEELEHLADLLPPVEKAKKTRKRAPKGQVAFA